MDNKEFDNIIKKKLESLNTNGSEDAWDLFKEKWDVESNLDIDVDESSVQDEDFDAKIKKDMKELRIPFNSKHWIILKEQLELEALFKKKLFVAKSVELVILAFIVLGILNLWPIQKDIYQIRVYDSPMVASVPVDKASAEKFKIKENSLLKKQRKLVNSASNAVKRMIAPLATLTNSTSNIKPVKNTGSKTRKPTLRSASEFEVIDRVRGSIPFINDHNQLLKDAEAKNEEIETKNQSITQALDRDLKKLDIPVRPIGYPDIALVKKSNRKVEKTYLSFALGPKVNLINSPFDPVYKFDPYNTINTNFNISAKISKEIGPIELYAGLGYTNTSYEPRLVDEIYEPLEYQFNVASLENIKFKTINVPLGVKYNYVNSKRVQLYAAAGVDLNVIADSEYIIKDVPFGRPGPTATPPPRNSVNENSKLSQKEFNKGIFAGGSLKDNLYATASIALGLNMNLSSHTGIFIEPRYSHFVSSKGIGPNEDKVHGLSIDLGVRYQLN